MRQLRKGLRVVVLVLATASASACAPPPPVDPSPSTVGPASSGTSSASAEAASSPTLPTTGAVIALQCSDGAVGLNAPSGPAPALGLVSEIWGQDDARRLDVAGPSHAGRTFIKSPLYATETAQAGTRLRVESPANAGLFYTNWEEWGSGALSDKSLVTRATREIEVGGCGAETVGFPGGIVVEGPSCVVLLVTAPDGGGHEEFTVSIGDGCPAG